MTQQVKNLPAMQEIWVQSLGQEDPLEREVATHSSVLVWKIPWTEEPGGLQSMESQSPTRLSTHTQLCVLEYISEVNIRPTNRLYLLFTLLYYK